MSQLPGHPDPGRRAEPAQPFAGVDPGLIEQAMHPGHRLTARVRLTRANGNRRSVPASGPRIWHGPPDSASGGGTPG